MCVLRLQHFTFSPFSNRYFNSPICNHKLLFKSKPSAAVRAHCRLFSIIISPHDGFRLNNAAPSAPRSPIQRELACKRPAQRFRSGLNTVDC
jgi:hypothetical protein